jgi:hypothetical protein
MARNAEKAQSMLYRFREAKAAELAGDKGIGRRGGAGGAGGVDTIPKAEKVRGELIADITAKISRMHDPTLTDAQLREMNDHINRAMDRKYGMERRIMALGGPDLRVRGGCVGVACLPIIGRWARSSLIIATPTPPHIIVPPTPLRITTSTEAQSQFHHRGQGGPGDSGLPLLWACPTLARDQGTLSAGW